MSNEESGAKCSSHLSQIACSQHGSRKALTASLLQIAHRSLIGMSSGARELGYESQYSSRTADLRSPGSLLDKLNLSFGQRHGHDCFAVAATSSRASSIGCVSGMYAKGNVYEVASLERGIRVGNAVPFQVGIDENTLVDGTSPSGITVNK